MTAGTAANRTTTSASLAAIGRNGDERVTGPMAPVRASRPDLPGSLFAPPIAESRIVLDFGERGVHLLDIPPDPLDEAARSEGGRVGKEVGGPGRTGGET